MSGNEISPSPRTLYLRLPGRVDDGQEEVDGDSWISRTGRSGNVVVSLQRRVVVAGVASRTASQVRALTARTESWDELPLLPQRGQ